MRNKCTHQDTQDLERTLVQLDDAKNAQTFSTSTFFKHQTDNILTLDDMDETWLYLSFACLAQNGFSTLPVVHLVFNRSGAVHISIIIITPSAS